MNLQEITFEINSVNIQYIVLYMLYVFTIYRCGEYLNILHIQLRLQYEHDINIIFAYFFLGSN